jgi:ADP-heptose:LPS heptosyltransferase
VRPLPSWLSDALGAGGEGLTTLVVRLSALGDVLRVLPGVRILRRALPRARIAWAVDERCAVAIAGHPDLDDVIALPRAAWRAMLVAPTRWAELGRSTAAFGRRLRAVPVGLALDFHGNLRSGVLARWSGAPVRLGHAGHQQKEGNRWFTTHRCPARDRRTSRVERNLALVRALGIDPGELPALDLPLVAAGRPEAERVLAELGLAQRSLAIVNPGASRAQAYKAPPAPLLGAACEPVAAAGTVPVVVWGPGERSMADAVVEAARGAARLAPATDLAALAALLARARLFVGGDSGPLHLACAVGCPVLGVYGPTDPEVNRPWGVPHRVVAPAGRRYTGIKRRDRRGGFGGLSAAEVAAAAEELLGTTGGRGR